MIYSSQCCLKSIGEGFIFDSQLFLTFMISRFLVIIQVLLFHTLMAADKDAGTPRVFLARHGLPILESIVIPHANTLYRSD